MEDPQEAWASVELLASFSLALSHLQLCSCSPFRRELECLEETFLSGHSQGSQCPAGAQALGPLFPGVLPTSRQAAFPPPAQGLRASRSCFFLLHQFSSFVTSRHQHHLRF